MVATPFPNVIPVDFITPFTCNVSSGNWFPIPNLKLSLSQCKFGGVVKGASTELPDTTNFDRL